MFGASHLQSDLAKEFIYETQIFWERLVIPALRNEHNGDLSKAIGNNDKIASLFNSYVEWNLQENTKWFHYKILEGFKDEKSILRMNLQNTKKKI